MTPYSFPRGPRSALAQVVHMRDPFPLMLSLAKDYGDPLTCPILGQDPMVLTWSPEGAKAVFGADPGTFAPGTADALAVIVGRGSIFMKAGDEHRRARRLLSPPFHGERMRTYALLMRDATRRAASAIAPGRSTPILETAQTITLDIIIEAIFGEQDRAKVAELGAAILGIVEAFHPMIATFRFLQRDFGGIGPWAKFRRRAEALHALIRALIAEKRDRPGDDVLSLLIATRDEDGGVLSEEEIIEQLITFVIAGHETTATSLAWAMYELHRAPATLARLREELAVAGAASPEAIARLPFLEAVCNETLRMHPPVPIVPRRCRRDFTLGEHTLPEGTNIGVAIYLAHHREEAFPEPFAFRPERFLERTYSPFELMPFGGGARRCLGAAFAMYELRIVLAELIGAHRFTLDEPAPVRNAFRIGTFGPATGVRMTLAA
jgi:cytochrome P450